VKALLNQNNMRQLTYILLIGLFVASCTANTQEESPHHTPETHATYTCTMHPDIVQDKPGKCPVCGMDLIVQASHNKNSLMLTDTQLKLANITTAKAGIRPMGQMIIANGRLTVDEEQSEVISSRAKGRIEKLYIKETGRSILAGEPLYELYSEELLTIQQEYLILKEQYDASEKSENQYASFLKASKKKLLLYGLSQNQINQLSQSKIITQRIVFYSPTSGIVTEVNASEGQYLTEGTPLYRIEKTNKLWLEAELYLEEISVVSISDTLQVIITGYESTPVETIVTFLNPEYRSNTQITLLRASIDNRNSTFKPGIQAKVKLIHSSHKALVVPTDAVIREEKGTHVYVLTDKNTFQPRKVKTGFENRNEVEITEGLDANEIIATSGAYLLYSEWVLKKGSHPVIQYVP
jgi:membrane fusion protein, copper/silver efflux system